MSDDFVQVTASALLLNVEERAALAQRLLATLDELSETDLEALWILEIERRSAEVDRGDATLVDADEAFRSLHALLEKCR